MVQLRPSGAELGSDNRPSARGPQKPVHASAMVIESMYGEIVYKGTVYTVQGTVDVELINNNTMYIMINEQLQVYRKVKGVRKSLFHKRELLSLGFSSI